MKTQNKSLSQLLIQIRSDYLESFPTRLTLLRELLNAQNWTALETEYHKLKGNGHTVGISNVSTVAGELESYLKKHKGNPADIKILEIGHVLFDKIYQSELNDKPLKLESDLQWNELGSLLALDHLKK